MPVTFSSYRLGPGQRVSYKTVPPPWDWLLRRENELGPRRSKSQIIFAVLVPPLYVAVQAPALIVTVTSTFLLFSAHINGGGKSSYVMRFFYKFCQTELALQSAKQLHFISTPWSDLLAIITTELLQLWWLSQVVGPGFEPGLVLEIFCFRASRSWVRTSPSPYFFAISVSRKISRCLAGVL